MGTFLLSPALPRALGEGQWVGAGWPGEERATYSLGFPLLNKPMITDFFCMEQTFLEGHQRDWLQFFWTLCYH